ncbi:hypothetical protein D3C84_835020 [compost metagenome]
MTLTNRRGRAAILFSFLHGDPTIPVFLVFTELQRHIVESQYFSVVFTLQNPQGKGTIFFGCQCLTSL